MYKLARVSFCTVPVNFYELSRPRQIVLVCLERIRISDPQRYKQIIDRAALRGKMSRRRKQILKNRKAVNDLEKELEEARVSEILQL